MVQTDKYILYVHREKHLSMTCLIQFKQAAEVCTAEQLPSGSLPYISSLSLIWLLYFVREFSLLNFACVSENEKLTIINFF